MPQENSNLYKIKHTNFFSYQIQILVQVLFIVKIGLCPILHHNVILKSKSNIWTCPTDDRINVTPKSKFALRRVGQYCGKRGNACYQHFLLFPKCFQTASSGGKHVLISHHVSKRIPS